MPVFKNYTRKKTRRQIHFGMDDWGNWRGVRWHDIAFPRRNMLRRTKARTCPRTPKPHSECRRGNGSRRLVARSLAMNASAALAESGVLPENVNYAV